MLKKFALAAAAAGALTFGSLALATPGQAAAGAYSGAPAVESNIIQAHCWRGYYGRWHCGPGYWHRRHCWRGYYGRWHCRPWWW
jgi:hypothetical protein